MFVHRLANGTMRHIDGIWWEDYTNIRSAFDAEVRGVGRVDIITLFSSDPTKNSTEYFHIRHSHKCHIRSFNGKAYPVFDWVANAKMGSSCRHRHGGTGTSWVSTGTAPHPTITLCANNNGTLPFWIDLKWQTGEQRFADFFTYTAGPPDPAHFALPRSCH